jgi:hypothetical protein
MSWKKSLQEERKLLASLERLAGLPSSRCRFFDHAYQKLMQEALTISHDLPIFINSLKKKFGDIIQSVHAKNLTPSLSYKHGRPYCVDVVMDASIQHKLSELEQVCAFHGYFISKVNGNNYLFEPKYPVKLNIRDLNIQYLYHTTPSKNIPRIQAIGLTPRDSQTSYVHPGNRIYLMYTPNKTHLNMLRGRLAADKKMDVNDTSVLRINAQNISNLYFDENATSTTANIMSFFTTINVNPKSIVDITQQL